MVAQPKGLDMADNWYRSSEWSKPAQEEFERRLRRARNSNRPQYLRIKALALLEQGGRKEGRAARELLNRVIQDYPDSLDVVVAHEALGESYAREGSSADAEEQYRTALRLSQEGPVRGDAPLRLPELLIETGGKDKHAEAERILDAIDVEGDLVFASQRFRYAVCRARLAHARGDASGASEYAAAALQVAARDTPDFPRHPTVGLVQAGKTLLNEMRRLVRG